MYKYITGDNLICEVATTLSPTHADCINIWNGGTTPKALYVAFNNTITYNDTNTSTKTDSSTKYYKLGFDDLVTGFSVTDLRPGT